MSASQRRKGAAGEREVCAYLSGIFDERVKRNLSQSRDGGDDIRVAGLVVEVKRRKRIAVLRWMEQAKRAAGDGGVPVVVMREDDGKWYGLVRLDHLFHTIPAILESRDHNKVVA